MVGYNMLNPSAANTVLPQTIATNIGVQCMFAVRNAFSSHKKLQSFLQTILDKGQGGSKLKAREDMIDVLTQNGVSGSITEAAYRFCRHTPGIHVVLTGTGNKEHLLENLRSIAAPPLPKPILDELHELFGDVDCVSGE
jgi:L-galactose dehydrogenase